MGSFTLPKLEEIFREHLLGDETITGYHSNRLTNVGENYGSLMLQLSLQVKNSKNGKKRELEVVAKLPPKAEFMQKMFNTPVTFTNEVNFYRVIIPEFEEYLTELNLPEYLQCFPKHYASKLEFDPSKGFIEEDEALLVLENLKVAGYTNKDRTLGFDLETTKSILGELAKFHSVPIALKHQKPGGFAKLQRFLEPYTVFEFDPDSTGKFWEKYSQILNQIDVCKPYMEKIQGIFLQNEVFVRNKLQEHGKYSTIIHTDLWVNNIMVNGTKCKFVDFQLYEYGSLAKDVFFFLFTGVESQVLGDNYKMLVEYYHENLVESLTVLGCETKDFTMESFETELKAVCADTEFMHVFIMLEPIFATTETMIDPDELSEENIMAARPVPPLQIDKCRFVLEQFIQRGFI